MKMEDIHNMVDTSTGVIDIACRIGLAALFGLLIGLDRDAKNKPIDLRSYIIVAVGTTLIALLTIELASSDVFSSNTLSIDPARVISGTLTGIGFLGAGAILHVGGKKVVGTATGASIWAAGALGLTIGFGEYNLAIISFIVIYASLLVLGCVINWIAKRAEDVQNEITDNTDKEDT